MTHRAGQVPTATMHAAAPSTEEDLPTPEQINAARGLISDCSWTDLEPEDICNLSTAEVIDGVERHYVGGWERFVADALLAPGAGGGLR
jgi:hypothetical protein